MGQEAAEVNILDAGGSGGRCLEPARRGIEGENRGDGSGRGYSGRNRVRISQAALGIWVTLPVEEAL